MECLVAESIWCIRTINLVDHILKRNFKDSDLEREKILSKKNAQGSPKRLGHVGLALNYENMVNQIDTPFAPRGLT